MGSRPGRQISPSALREIVHCVAGRPDLWRHLVAFDLTDRFSTRLYRSECLEIWLICWDLGQDTLLHDHGGSVGAFAVASGTLLEDSGSISSTELRTRERPSGTGASFGRSYLHNLVNAGLEPAVSIHAYSEPLTSMNFYCWLPTGMHYLRTIPCEAGEPETGELERTAAALRMVG